MGKASARTARPQHPEPGACREEDCQRAACRAYRDGREYGYQDGFAEGFSAGLAAGSST